MVAGQSGISGVTFTGGGLAGAFAAAAIFAIIPRIAITPHRQ
jgi:hypothetical protein